MAVTKAADLALAKNETATEFVVAMLWQLLERAVGSTPLEDSALRMSRNHVRELAELHGLDQDTLCPKSTAEGGNVNVNMLGGLEPAHANGQGQ